MNYEIISIDQNEHHVTVVTIFGEDCAATYDLPNKFVKKYTEENGLNKYETEYGSGEEAEHDIDTYISEEIRSIVEHILAEDWK